MHHQSTSKCMKVSFGGTNHLDHINELPDDLLLVILDKLPVEAAISTSLLSKRWKDLWKSKNRVDLGYSWVEKTHKTVLDSLYRVIDDHRQPKILCISVARTRSPLMFFEMGKLMESATLKNVEEMYLDLNERRDTRNEWTRRYAFVYFLREYWVRSYSSPVKLCMKFLRFENFRLRLIALRELFLEHVKLSNNVVEKITTNCPSLELLSLCNCNPTTDLRIEVVVGSGLVRLVIKEDLTQVRNRKLFIRAMNVKMVEFGLALPRKEYHIEGIQACSCELTFRLNQMLHSQQTLRVTSRGVRRKFSNNFLGLLNEFSAAKVLTLSSWCIQVLSIEVVKFKAPQLFQATHLTLETGLKRWEFAGIAYMLLACHKLKHLVIVMGDHIELNLNNVKRSRYSGATEVDYPRALQDLTMVEFRNFCGDYQTWEDGSFNVDQFFSGFKYGALLLWNFRTYAKNLRKIVFLTRRKRYETDQFQSFGQLPCDNMLQPKFYRVPHLFINKSDWSQT